MILRQFCRRKQQLWATRDSIEFEYVPYGTRSTLQTGENQHSVTGIGATGCQTLFDDLPEIILPYAKQQCSMVPSVRNLPGMEYQDWTELKPQQFDKEFFDTNTGTWMIASYVGLNPEFGITIETQEATPIIGGNWLDVTIQPFAVFLAELAIFLWQCTDAEHQ